MNISLTPQLESYVKQKVAGGMYNSASEVVREALRQDINQGLASLDNGEGKPLDIDAIKTKVQAAQRGSD